MPDLCLSPKAEDGSKCTRNTHDETTAHAYATRLDPRLHLLDGLADTFREEGEWRAYHHVRAVAHGLGFHLSSCTTGLKVVRRA